MIEANKGLIFFVSGMYFTVILDNFVTRPKMRTDEVVVSLITASFALICAILLARMDHKTRK